MEKKLIRTHQDLDVYQMGFEVAMKIFKMSKSFPMIINPQQWLLPGAKRR